MLGGLVEFLYECVWGGGLWISGALVWGSFGWRQGLMPLRSGGRIGEWNVLSGRRETGCLELFCSGHPVVVFVAVLWWLRRGVAPCSRARRDYLPQLRAKGQ